MDAFYIREKNVCNQRIKEIDRLITRNKTTISTFKSKGSLSDFEKTQIQKLNTTIDNYKNELLELNQRMEDLLRRRLNHEYEEEKNKVVLLNNKAKDKMTKLNDDKVVQKKEQEKYNVIARNINRYNDTSFISTRQMDNEYRRYMEAYDKIPEKVGVKRYLKDMPNNKGYIWNGVWFFGELPAEKNGMVVMFEKVYNSNILRTYEFDDTHMYVYEKHGKDRKKFVYKEERSGFHKHTLKMREYGMI